MWGYSCCPKSEAERKMNAAKSLFNCNPYPIYTFFNEKDRKTYEKTI